MPEIAARAHLDHLDELIAGALSEAGIGFNDLDGVAATGGPGLIGGVIVGVMTGKAIALARGLPFVAVNHLEGHALSVRLSHGIDFPYLLLLVSGGHCQLLAVEGVGRYRPPRHHDRRRRRRGLRQERQAARPGLSRRAGDRTRAADGDRDAVCPAAPAEGPPRLRLLLRRPQDGDPPAGREMAGRHDCGARRRRHRRVLPGGRGGRAGRPHRERDPAVRRPLPAGPPSRRRRRRRRERGAAGAARCPGGARTAWR